VILGAILASDAMAEAFRDRIQRSVGPGPVRSYARRAGRPAFVVGITGRDGHGPPAAWPAVARAAESETGAGDPDAQGGFAFALDPASSPIHDRPADGRLIRLTWDPHSVRLTSDRFGESSLQYWLPHPGILVFADNLAALISVAQADVALDRAALGQQRVFGAPVGATTFLRGVRRMGWHCTAVSASASGATLEVTEQPAEWAMPLGPVPSPLSPQTLRENLSSCAARPDGVILLSGGLDSTVLAACLAGLPGSASGPVALTFGAPNSEDVHMGRLAARRLGLDHRCVWPSARSAWRCLPSAVLASEQPRVSPVLAPVMDQARRLGGWVATAEGADQVFGGSWFQRFDADFVRRLVANFRRVPWHDAMTAGLLSWILNASPGVRAHRARRLELEHLLPFRSISLLRGHAHAAGIEIRFPFLSDQLLNAVEADPGQYLEPLGWKPWLRRAAAPALVPRSMLGLVLGQAKRSPMIAVGQLVASLAERLRATIPGDWLHGHPGLMMSGGNSERAADIFSAASLDLFVLIFCVYRAAPPPDLDLTNLYRDPRLRGCVQDAYGPLREDLCGSRPVRPLEEVLGELSLTDGRG
jgi:hypothetical protein